MGAAASASGNVGVDEQSQLVASQAEKIHRLQAELEACQAENRKLRAAEEPSSGKSSRPTMMKLSSTRAMSASGGDSGGARRGEVSAEVFNQFKEKQPSYKKVSVPKSEAARELIARAVGESVLFKGLREDEKAECVEAFFKEDHEAGVEVIKQGDTGDNFYVIESGSAEILVRPNGKGPEISYGHFKGGMSFGELALMYNTPRAATVKTDEKTVVWVLKRATFRSIHLHYKSKRKDLYEGYLRKVHGLEHLSPKDISRLADAVEEHVYEAGTVIIREGETGDVFYMIEEGEVSYSTLKDGMLESTGKAGDFFGEKALLTEDVRAATVTATSKLICLTVERNDFVALLGSLDEIKEIAAATEAGENGAVDAEHKYHEDIKYEDLEQKLSIGGGAPRQIILGQGAFGRVCIVKHSKTGKTYALKCLNKMQIVENGLEQHVVDERKVMTMIDHPFLLKLHNSYWDDKYVYLLLELCLGGELFTFLRKAGRFTEKASRFYAATVVRAFEHMHNKKIIYRDLKPENLMLDNNGYLKVVDFGLAKVVTDRTWTLCGTPDYLAPEIILSKGHDKAVDYWALGVLIYEMTAGFVPFYADDPMDVYQLILQGELKFPTTFSRSCTDMIRRLMHPTPTKRLGNTKDGVKALVKMRWFAGFDWQGLVSCELKPPYKPEVADSMDVSNFDDYPNEDLDCEPCAWEPEFPHQIL